MSIRLIAVAACFVGIVAYAYAEESVVPPPPSYEQPTDPDDDRAPSGIKLLFLGDLGTWARGTLVNPERVFVRHPPHDRLWGATLERQIAIGRGLSANINLLASYRRESGNDNAKLDALEGYLRYQTSNNRMSVAAGKIRTTWSQNITFHPIDLFGVNAHPKSTVSKRSYDPAVNEGVNSIKWRWLSERFAVEAIVADASRNTSYPGDQQVATKVGAKIGEASFSVLAERTAGHEARWGGGLSGNVGESWTFNVEFLSSKEREIPQVRRTANPVAIGPTLTLPARFDYATASRKSRNKLLLSLNHVFPTNDVLETSYYYNGHGFGSGEWASTIDALRETNTAFRSPLNAIFPDPRANPHASFLLRTSGLARDFYLRRHYLALRWDSMNRFAPYQFEQSAAVSLEDGSASLHFAINRTLYRDTNVRLFVIRQVGRANAEYGFSPFSTLWGALVTYSF